MVHTAHTNAHERAGSHLSKRSPRLRTKCKAIISGANILLANHHPALFPPARNCTCSLPFPHPSLYTHLRSGGRVQVSCLSPQETTPRRPVHQYAPSSTSRLPLETQRALRMPLVWRQTQSQEWLSSPKIRVQLNKRKPLEVARALNIGRYAYNSSTLSTGIQD